MARRSSQTMILGTVPYTPVGTVLCNRPGTNNIVGADISLYSIVGTVNPHTVRPPTCLWASTVLWAPAFIVPCEHGETHMPLGINSIAGTDICHTRTKRCSLPCASDIQQYCGRLPSSYTCRRGQQGLEAFILSPTYL